MVKNIVIVGAGVVGLSTAFYALRRGFRVTLIERRPAQARVGCSFGNAGLISPSHVVPLAAPGMVALGLRWMWNPESPFYVRPRPSLDLLRWGARFWRASTPARVRRAAPVLRDLLLASRAGFRDSFAPALDDFGLESHGLLMLCKTPQGLAHEAQLATLARELGLPAEVLDAKATAAREPDVRMDIAGAVFFPLDCHLDPARLMTALQAEVARQGAEFRWETELRGWEQAGRRLTAVRARKIHGREEEEKITGDEFVLCGGAWSPALARPLRLALPMQAGKGYSLTLRQPRARPRTSAILVEARVAVTPMGESLRFGGTMELGGGHDERINPRRVAGILKSVPRYFPDFTPDDFREVEPWCGLRPVTPDGLPYVGRPAAWENLVVAAGHAMLGISLGPITGRLVTELLAGERPSVDLTLLSPDRYR